ncbi:MAG: glycine cleavage system protein R [Halothiobacillaceae bacterium]|jgi:glycine cleavage system transcriptional repressor|nr:glycine cleavage system protein R [Halothiobacillaceae bacterium]
MQTRLVVTFAGPDRPDLLQRLLPLIAQNRCQLHDSRLIALGSEFTGCLMILGSWDRLARLETALNALSSELGLALTLQRAEGEPPHDSWLPYVVDAIGLASQDVAGALTRFFLQHEIRVRELSTQCYTPARSSEPLMSLRALVDVPSDLHIAHLKNAFFDLCDSMNLDAALDPDRGS